MPVGVFVKLYGTGCVLVRGELHGWVGDNEAGTAMRKDDVCDLSLSADVVGFFWIEMRKPLEECRPREIGICLHEDIPFGIVLISEGLLHHREEFPFVELPARVVGLADVGVGLVSEVGRFETGATLFAETIVEVEVGNGVSDSAVHCAESVMDFDAFDFFFEIREDNVVRDAAQRCLEVNGDFVEGFGDTCLHDHQDIFDPLERGTFGRLIWSALRGALRSAELGSAAGVELWADGEKVVEEEYTQEGGEDGDATKSTDCHC